MRVAPAAQGRPGSEYLRALLLPEIGAISQPAMLIAPRLPFREGHKVLIKREGEEQRAVLNRRRTGTGNYNQFEYRSLGQVAPERETPVTGWKTHTAGGDEDFDSLWKSLQIADSRILLARAAPARTCCCHGPAKENHPPADSRRLAERG